MASSGKKTSVLVTGCTPGGIGHALCLEFHKRGCHVIATARRLELLKDLAEQGMSTLALDVTDQKSIVACRDEVAAITGGRLDILINNAGIGYTIPALDVEIERTRAIYETNVFGPMMMCQAFISLLISARGLIVNISSGSTLIPYLFGGIYSSSKGALNVYSRALRMELRPFNVRVMVSLTGTVRSNIVSHHSQSGLPASSLYAPVNDIFLHRLTFSQRSGTVPAEAFAEKLAAQALKGEGWLGGWFGRTPDLLYAGGMENVLWLTNVLPNWLTNYLTGRFFSVDKISRTIQAAKRD